MVILCLALLTALAPVPVSATGEDSIQMENRELELKELRSRIRDLKFNIETAISNTDTYLQDLQEREQAALRAANRLEETEDSIESSTDRLAELGQDKARWEKTLAEQRARLAEQVRTVYKSGRHDIIKLLLNQEDPSQVGRMVAYHEFHNRARVRKMEEVRESLDTIAHLQSSIRDETAELKELRATQVAELEEYKRHRVSREAIITELQEYIATQGRQLQHLQENEEELATLLNRLKTEQQVIQAYEELPPFDSLKGKLSWPVEGRFISRFGEARKGGKLRSLGVRIAAASGQDVHAVSAGKVIFADWFRTMGLLLIIDHGDGYMSLYGNNQQLLKKPGDMAAAGEVVARAGDTGGQSQSGVYFEIRRQGDPQNPSLWCRR